jgi:hypothetical protein
MPILFVEDYTGDHRLLSASKVAEATSILSCTPDRALCYLGGWNTRVLAIYDSGDLSKEDLCSMVGMSKNEAEKWFEVDIEKEGIEILWDRERLVGLNPYAGSK